MAISTLLVDDHAFTLSGMQRSLEDAGGFSVVGATGLGIEAISLAKRLKPDLAVIDYVLPDATGLEVALEIARWVPDTKLAIVSGGVSGPEAKMLRKAGVSGLFLKGQGVDEICSGLRDVAMGVSNIDAHVANLPSQGDDIPSLTSREFEVLMAIGRGLTNKGIANDLNISPKTVDTHRTNLMRKIGVNSTAQLLVRATKLGLAEF